MKVTALTRENGETISGNVVEIGGGLAELFGYFARKVDWSKFLRGFRRPGIERQYFVATTQGVKVTIIVAPEDDLQQHWKPSERIR